MTAPTGPAASRWSGGHLAALLAGFGAAVVVRALLLPTPGLTGDLDQFVLWVHHIATNGIGRAYDQNVSFPPVMVYVWSALAALDPVFRTVTDSSDAGVRVVMKLPATLADVGLALGVLYALRGRPGWAIGASLAILLHPAVIDISAWWGQYESIYALGALTAYLLAIGGRPGWAVVVLGVALMTKPQALPFAVPFAAWYVARFGWVSAIRYGLLTAVTVVVLWIPFLAANGPLNYARNLAEYQGGIFAVLSLRAWNPWWLIQEAVGRGEFVAEPPLFRLLGYGIAALLAVVIFLAVLRAPTPRGLALGLAAASLASFVALTTMHERYAFGALVFLAPLLPDRRVLVLWLAFSVVFTLNLLAAVPPTEEIGRALPVFGALGVIGSVAMTTIAGATLWLLLREPRPRTAEQARHPAAERDGVPAQIVG